MIGRVVVLTVAAALASTMALAQEELVTTPPPNLVVSNYNSTSVGPYGGLERTAYVARVDDPSAAWFNPAGLARQASASIGGPHEGGRSGSTTVHQLGPRGD